MPLWRTTSNLADVLKTIDTILIRQTLKYETVESNYLTAETKQNNWAIIAMKRRYDKLVTATSGQNLTAPYVAMVVPNCYILRYRTQDTVRLDNSLQVKAGVLPLFVYLYEADRSHPTSSRLWVVQLLRCWWTKKIENTLSSLLGTCLDKHCFSRSSFVHV